MVSPLHTAAARGDATEVRRLLASGANPSAPDPVIGASPLHSGAQSDNVEVVDALLTAGAFVNQQAPSHGMTPLMVAAWHRRTAIVRRLLAEPDVNLGLRNVLGLTAADTIGLGGAGEADPAHGIDAEIRGMIAAAVESQRAMAPGHELIAEALQPQPDLDRMTALLDAGADVNAKAPNTGSGNDGHTALHIAARDGNAALAALLLDRGADQAATDTYMLAVPAHKAAYFGHADVLRVLCAHPSFARVANAQGPFNGYTPMHDAVWHGHLEAVRVLLAAGVRTDLPGHDGRTAAQLAADSGYGDIAAAINGGSTAG